MVDKEIIIKSIDDAIWKCNNSDKAKKIGSNVSLVTNEKGYTLTYGDGTSLTFDENNNLINLNRENNKDYPYLQDDCYNTFDYQKDTLKSSETFQFRQKTSIDFGREYKWESYSYENDWDFITDYITNFATYRGMQLNKDLARGEKGRLNSHQGIVRNLKSHNHFVDIERNTPCDTENYVTLRIQTKFYDNDWLDKGYYTNKHHTCMSVGADTDMLIGIFADSSGPHRNSPYSSGRFYDGGKEIIPWRIYTTIDKNSGVNGLFFGNAVRESPKRSNNDWEAELNLPPNTRFVRDIIDEKNHIIIQHVSV